MAARFLDREGLFIIALGGVALVTLVLAGYFLFNPPQVRPPSGNDSGGAAHPESTAVAIVAPANDSLARPHESHEVLVPGKDGHTVLELLEAEHQVQIDTELLVFGSIILAIDSIRAAPDEYWVYYRDSMPGDRPPEACTTSTGETIRWELKRRR
jgi:hypothetical protein